MSRRAPSFHVVMWPLGSSMNRAQSFVPSTNNPSRSSLSRSAAVRSATCRSSASFASLSAASARLRSGVSMPIHTPDHRRTIGMAIETINIIFTFTLARDTSLWGDLSPFPNSCLPTRAERVKRNRRLGSRPNLSPLPMILSRHDPVFPTSDQIPAFNLSNGQVGSNEQTSSRRAFASKSGRNAGGCRAGNAGGKAPGIARCRMPWRPGPSPTAGVPAGRPAKN
ncbi:hypothetical protein SBV1_1240022 [Verrucomicrobia bacterium]|nr:hypothetical protein SBV1_1240022 [Verrucomicrobiota bacterium]